MKFYVVAAGLSLALWLYVTTFNGVTLGPGVMAPHAPVQAQVYNPQVIQVDDFTITPLASFQIEAKVLGKKRYYLGSEAKMAPIDLALGWGRMSDEAVLDSIDVFQTRRWYHWTSKTKSIGDEEIKTCSANMHIIPATDEVAEKLKSVREGEIATIVGYLVRVDNGRGWRWISSLSRSDKGDGACEIVYAEDLQIREIDSK